MKTQHIDALELRRLFAGNPTDLTDVVVAHPTIHYYSPNDDNVPFYTASPTGLTPAKIRGAYGIGNILWGSVTGDGSGQTIAIIDAYDNPKFVSSSSASYNTSDLYYFNNTYGLQQFGVAGGPTFTKVNQTGGTTYPTGNTGWGGEIALDVEWAHVIAPKANIILVEASSASNTNLLSIAVNWARQQPGVTAISMSFGIDGGFSGETSYDTYFTTPAGHAGVSFFASSGDAGNPGGYPAESPNVVAVGGTKLITSGNNWSSETAWGNGANSTTIGGSGGGISTQESKPSYQSAVTQSATQRTIPDLSMDADPNSGVPVYDSYGGGTTTPWVQVGGTSLSAPLMAGVAAILNQGRLLAGGATADGRTDLLPKLYALPTTDYHDIVSGSINNGISAAAGYDLVTGIGTPKTDLWVPDLVGAGVPSLTAASDSGVSSTDKITNITLPTFTGIATTGATVQIYADNVLVGTGVSGAANTYNITITTPLSEGTHTIVSKVGTNTSTSLSITVDTTAPTAPAAPALAAAKDSGISNSDGITNINTPTLNVTTTGAYYRLLRNGVQVSGNYDTAAAFNESALADNTYQYTTIAVDAAGNASSPSGAATVTIDTVAPQLTSTTANLLSSQSVVFAFSESVNNPTFGASKITLSNQTDASTFASTDLSIAYNDATNQAVVTWPLQAGGLLNDGFYTASLQSGITDVAGNALASGAPANFHFLNADANDDLLVDAQDFNVLAGNFGQAGGFADGNFDYTGTVDSTDFDLFLAHYGKRISPPAAPVAGNMLSGPTTSLFGESAVSDDLTALDPIV